MNACAPAGCIARPQDNDVMLDTVLGTVHMAPHITFLGNEREILLCFHFINGEINTSRDCVICPNSHSKQLKKLDSNQL